MTTEQFNERFEKCIRQSVYGITCPLTDKKRVVEDLGADSLDVFQIIMSIEEEFDIEINQEDAEKIVTVGDAVEAIRSVIY